MKTIDAIKILDEELKNNNIDMWDEEKDRIIARNYDDALSEAIYALKSWLAIQKINDEYRSGKCTADHYYNTLAAIIVDMIKEGEV